uniref:Reverse transcriptase RNase H-like domain-containing protein n=1 Tax=Ananas comosus var. bracteatus TaxID=296719 RepID=A0A6V7NT25_ANACO|nr:unnamed protein product [Ananas comosus var. bracteatus]
MVRGGLEEQLLHALDLNSGGIKIEVADFYGKMHAEDYLDWEASIENYFEWKPMAENRKVLFVKLKLKGTALQWWKRVEEQRARQGKPKVSTWEQMKIKLQKQFLPADYTMEQYEKFHSLKQQSMNVEEYNSEFYNLSIREGLNKTNEQVTSRYLAELNPSIRDEMGVVNLPEIEDNEYDESEPIYDDYVEDSEEVDIHPVQGESLVVRRVMTTAVKEEEEDWSVIHNAFHTGNGAILSQDEKPIEFFSEKLSDAKRRYSTYDMEFYALVRAIQHWEHYLAYWEFVVYSDHQALRGNRYRIFLVKWLGKTASESTWITEDELLKIDSDMYDEVSREGFLTGVEFSKPGRLTQEL